MEDHDARQLCFVIAAVTEYSSKFFTRELKSCLSSLLRPKAVESSVVVSFEYPPACNNETKIEAVPLLIRALTAAHREIRDTQTLSILLESLSDPSVIPTAVLCSTIVPFYAIPVYLKSRQSHNAASDTKIPAVLIGYISRWMDEFPSLPQRALNVLRTARSVSRHGRFVLELYQHWFRSYPKLRTCILMELGDWLANQYRQAAFTKAAVCKQKRDRSGDKPNPTEKKRRQRLKLISLKYLHDGISSDEEDEEDAFQHSQPLRHLRPAIMALAQISQSSEDLSFSVTLLHATVELSHRLMTLSSHYEALVPRCADVRSLIVALLLEPTETTTPLLLVPVDVLLQQQHGERHKFSIRLLCALTVVNFQPDVVVAVCLGRLHLQPFLLIYLVELLIECRFYDNKRHLVAVLNQIPTPENVVDARQQQTLWKCLCTRRSKLLELTTNKAVQHILRDERLNELDEESVNLLSLRSSMDLLSPLCSKNKPALRFPVNFFSHYSPENSMPPQEHTKDAQESGYLSDECWLQIASFLNYKRVCKLRLVSSMLNNIMGAPFLWKSLYESRYPQYPVLQEEAQQLFRQRIAAERSIRGRCCQSDPTWRIQLCPLPGCLHVLTSRARAAAHAKRHQPKPKTKRATKQKNSGT